ncbi:ERBB receptor feedback inhibitor 1a [Nelusetta ayraudi]|uniref:ERBB receptor feedback inhibitor 1a n=1 Tax=Nelusetta ayraudi TaxID=303726 RepID=UPI003F6E6F6B
MRPECGWSMSTVGLTAQETSFPIENPFRGGSYCHSMAESKPTWKYPEDLYNFYFSIDTAHTDHASRAQLKGLPPPAVTHERHKLASGSLRLPQKKSRPSHLSLLSFTAEPSSPSPAEDDQVVPSFQRLSVCGSPPQTPGGRCSKPLPPIPPQSHVPPEPAVDSEVEAFMSTDESCCLVSAEPCQKMRGLHSRWSFRDRGQINPAYYDGPLQQQQQQHRTHTQQEVKGQYEQVQQVQLQQQQQQQQVSSQRPQDKSQKRLRRSHSGPAGSFNKPVAFRLPCPKRYPNGTDKPEVPPPVPPRTVKTGNYRRWSAEVSPGAYSDEDKPPKVPPREPLPGGGGSRTPSPKSLPTYVNGVMPPTQSFAPDPNYVVCRGLQRQNSEGSPCILPVMEDGIQASNTHYYLLPQRPAFLDSPCVEKFLRVMDGASARHADSNWDSHARRKAPVDLV